MRKQHKNDLAIGRSPLYLAIIATLFAASAADAAELSPAFIDQLATFKHVRVVNAPQLAARAAPQAGQQTLQPQTEFVDPSGAIGMILDESSMVFSVVHRTDGGVLAEFCVVGPEQATKVMNLRAQDLRALRRSEVRYER